MILRVFPRRTSQTPADAYAVIGSPLFLPKDIVEVHVSCLFTWDRPLCEDLVHVYERRLPGIPVQLGGPAIEGSNTDDVFVPGLYVRRGVIHTSRGCPNKCPWCLVPEREGALKELAVSEGRIIQDNNFLACSKRHRRKVYRMLRSQRRVRFLGGLESARLTQWDADQIRALRVKELWFAADTDSAVKRLQRVARMFSGMPRNKLRCYVLCAYAGQTIEQAEERLRRVWGLGFLPFAQLYREPFVGKAQYPKEWRYLARLWSRPAIMKVRMRPQGDLT